MAVLLFCNVQLRLLSKCSGSFIYFGFFSPRSLTNSCNAFQNVCFPCLKFISIVVVVIVVVVVVLNEILVSFVS
jgi:hypothetical protein